MGRPPTREKPLWLNKAIDNFIGYAGIAEPYRADKVRERYDKLFQEYTDEVLFIEQYLTKQSDQASLNVEASQKAARAYCDELARYKKALEVCKEQRNSQLIMDSEDLELIQELDEEIDQILEGEV